MSLGQLLSRVHSFGVGAPRAAHKRGTFEPDRLQIDHNPRREEQGTRSQCRHTTGSVRQCGLGLSEFRGVPVTIGLSLIGFTSGEQHSMSVWMH